MRIAVIGAGIGGLVAAVGLQRDGHEVTVYERRSQPGAVGAGLTLFENAFTALDAVGLGDAIRSISSGEIASMRAGQRVPHGEWLLTMPRSAVASTRSVHRVTLHQLLIDLLEPGSLHSGCDAQVSATGSPQVTIHDRVETFDLVVVADGMRSMNRARLGLDTGVRYAGYTAWRGVTERPVELHGEAGETWGHGQLFGIVPLPDERVYWFGTLSTPEGTTYPDEYDAVRHAFTDWHEPIQECIAATSPGEVIRHDIYDLADPLATFAADRTVLLGDAAHAMTPNLGQGAGQAIEDAATLTVLLRDSKVADLTETLARYDALRRKRTQTISQRSRLTGRLAQASHPLAVTLRNTALRLTPGAAMGTVSKRIQAWTVPQT